MSTTYESVNRLFPVFLAEVEIPLSLTRAGLAPFVEKMVAPLFAVFGASISSGVIQQMADGILKHDPM
jgi:hypothetical protein